MTEHTSATAFQPRIVAFVCQYCGYAAVDLAGTLQRPYPASLRVVRLPCSGKLDALHVLRAFEEGADGVCLVACTEDNCHHIDGSKRARKRVGYLQSLLKEIGLEPERLAVLTASSAMDGGFPQAATEMTERVRKLGPSPLRGVRREA